KALLLGGLLILPYSLVGQDLYRYTEDPVAGNIIALGYPVPIPVDSTLPVDAFRSYNSLFARHQDLSLQHNFIQAQMVGQTLDGREIWAYLLSDLDRTTRNAGAESSALVIGGVHAREWASPELTTGLIEAYAEQAGDQHLYDYLIENVSFTVLPVTNVDGFLQTQRYPTEVLIGRDPRVVSWPRDGRMRRKNMNNADEFLLTTNDHLSGVDLNRNNTPFFASNGGSSSNPQELIYHGTAAFSEPETQAILATAEWAIPERLRWYQDSHSFSQVFFSKHTFNSRRNRIQDLLLATYRRVHSGLSVERHGVPRIYRDLPDPAGEGIGVTAEYFAYTYEIPSWTLEIEPANGGEDYGGFGANHDGFVLPESEVNRMRTDMAITHAVVTYKQAGPPSIQRVQIINDRNDVVYSAQWNYSQHGQRALLTEQLEALLPGFDYTMIVTFDKPMRWAANDGPALAPGLNTVPFDPVVRILDTDSQSLAINPSNGQWLGMPGTNEAFLNYRYDSFQMAFTVPTNLDLAETTALRLSIDAEDFTGQSLDANPATVVDWVNGSWSGYEDQNGIAGDAGGRDTSLSVDVSTQGLIRSWLRRRR
ncbi:MAG: M14 family metallopeptidase, partial [Pseudomonadota bacterium]